MAVAVERQCAWHECNGGRGGRHADWGRGEAKHQRWRQCSRTLDNNSQILIQSVSVSAQPSNVHHWILLHISLTNKRGRAETENEEKKKTHIYHETWWVKEEMGITCQCYVWTQIPFTHTHNWTLYIHTPNNPKTREKLSNRYYFHHCNRQCATASAINKKKNEELLLRICIFAHTHTEHTLDLDSRGLQSVFQPLLLWTTTEKCWYQWNAGLLQQKSAPITFSIDNTHNFHKGILMTTLRVRHVRNFHVPRFFFVHSDAWVGVQTKYREQRKKKSQKSTFLRRLVIVAWSSHLAMSCLHIPYEHEKEEWNGEERIRATTTTEILNVSKTKKRNENEK